METRKRKALGEITNLIPTSLLRKLVNSNNKPPISILRSISSSTINPNFSEAACSNSSISSNNVSSARNSRTVHFKTPPISPGDVVSKDAGQNKMLNVEKSNKPMEADVVITSRTPVEKRKEKGIAIETTLFSPRHMKVKDNKNASTNLSSSLEKVELKGKTSLIILDEPAQNVKKTVKGIPNPSRCSNDKPDKGKEIAITSGPLVQKTEDVEKSFERTYSRSGSKTIPSKKKARRPSGIFIGESREVGSDFVNSSKSVGARTKDKSKALSNFVSSFKEPKDKGKAILPSTCPPKLRHMDYDSDGGGNTESLKSWTDPHPVARKKRCLKQEDFTELPREYIEQQNAYFKEVDSFELLEEEVSEDELD